MYRFLQAREAEENASVMLYWREGECRSNMEPHESLVVYMEEGRGLLVLLSRYLDDPPI